MHQYGIERVEISWNGLDFAGGIAAGVPFQYTLNGGGFSTRPTGRSRIVRSLDPDLSGTITVLVFQTSKLHQQLKARHIADRQTGSVVSPMQVTDLSTKEQLVFTAAHLKMFPGGQRGTEATDFSWDFNFEKYLPIPNLTDAAAVIET